MREKPHFLSFAVSSQIGRVFLTHFCSIFLQIMIYVEHLIENRRHASAPSLNERIPCDSLPVWRLARRAQGVRSGLRQAASKPRRRLSRHSLNAAALKRVWQRRSASYDFGVLRRLA